MKVIVTTVSGDRLFGEFLGAPEDIDKRMAGHEPVELLEVYSVVQMSVQVAPGVISRTTKLGNPEFYDQFNPAIRCLICSWYEPDSVAKQYIDEEIAEVAKRKEDADKGVDPMAELRKLAQQGGRGIAPVGPLPPGLLSKIRGEGQ
jgi:hypothetical protein